MSAKRIALVCMTPATDGNELGGMELPSFGIRRILAAVVADPELKDVKITLIDVRRPDVEAYVKAIDDFEPDLIGFSIYVWSMPCLVKVAQRIKQSRPGCAIVFGGPSARTAMFDLPPYGEPGSTLDAIVPSDGEITFREIARLPELSDLGLESVGGLDLPRDGGWRRTGPRTTIDSLDEIASPYQLGLMQKETVAYLETFRGCPLSCRFCEWGATDGAKTVFSADYLTRELEAYARNQVQAVFLVDAGLNLNAKGFNNLKTAEDRVGFLKTKMFWSEFYPSRMREEHLEFLASVKAGYLGIGLQSIDPEVLKAHDRPFNDKRFEIVVRQLAKVANVEIQIIFGLPSDSPEGFRRTVAYARSLGVSVRAYHCLVLPDALMTRSRPEWNVAYDPLTLEMISCQGWSESDLLGMRAEITQEVGNSGGMSGDYWWHFPPLAPGH